MKNIPKSLREKLEEVSFIGNLKIELSLKSKVDKTRKYLFELNDGNIIESVMMDYEDRVTACISNQVGCRMGCRFCASTLEGLIRNLEPWEIIDQILKIQEDIGKRVSNLVLMGSGEPLDNFENTKKFLRIVNDKNGLNIGYRHITLSTCGIAPKMRELADLEIPINLALSLHSPYDEKRKETEKFETIEEQKADMIKRFNSENERFFRLYGVHKEDMSNYDFVLDTTNHTIEENAKIIEEEYKKWLEI